MTTYTLVVRVFRQQKEVSKQTSLHNTRTEAEQAAKRAEEHYRKQGFFITAAIYPKDNQA
jgi:hypothetical protein